MNRATHQKIAQWYGKTLCPTRTSPSGTVQEHLPESDPPGEGGHLAGRAIHCRRVLTFGEGLGLPGVQPAEPTPS